MKNPGLLALSFLIATLLSLYVQNESNFTSVKLFVPIELKDLPSDKIVVWQLRKQVEIEIRGPQHLVSRIYSSPPVIRLRLPTDAGPRYVRSLEKGDVAISPPVQIVSIEPQKIEFSIENKVSKEVPVRAPRIGVVPEDVKLQSIDLSPERVIVSGPESEIKEIQRVETLPVDLADITESDTRDLTLRVPGKLSEINVVSVKAAIVVESVKTRRRFQALPVEIRSAPGTSVSVQPGAVDVEVSGPKERVATLRSLDVIPFIRVPSDLSSESQLAIQVDPPEGVTLIAVEPERARVVPASRPKGNQKR